MATLDNARIARIRNMLAAYHQRLEAAEEPVRRFNEITYRVVKGKPQGGAKTFKKAGHVIGFHQHFPNGSMPHQMYRILIASDGRAWGSAELRTVTVIISTRMTLTGYPLTLSDYPFDQYAADLEDFARRLEIDFRLRTTDKRYWDALMKDRYPPHHWIEWTWEH